MGLGVSLSVFEGIKVRRRIVNLDQVLSRFLGGDLQISDSAQSECNVVDFKQTLFHSKLCLNCTSPCHSHGGLLSHHPSKAEQRCALSLHPGLDFIETYSVPVSAMYLSSQPEILLYSSFLIIFFTRSHAMVQVY